MVPIKDCEYKSEHSKFRVGFRAVSGSPGPKPSSTRAFAENPTLKPYKPYSRLQEGPGRSQRGSQGGPLDLKS